MVRFNAKDYSVSRDSMQPRIILNGEIQCKGLFCITGYNAKVSCDMHAVVGYNADDL